MPIVLSLLLLSLLVAFAASWTMLGQQHMTSAQRFQLQAFYAAEAAARVGEDWIYRHYERANGAALAADPGGASGVHPARVAADSNESRFLDPERWTESAGSSVGTDAISYTGAEATARLPKQPRYLLQDLGPARPAGVSVVRENGITGGTGYQSGGVTPGGNDELRVYRITAKSRARAGGTVSAVESTFAGRAKD